MPIGVPIGEQYLFIAIKASIGIVHPGTRGEQSSVTRLAPGHIAPLYGSGWGSKGGFPLGHRRHSTLLSCKLASDFVKNSNSFFELWARNF